MRQTIRKCQSSMFSVKERYAQGAKGTHWKGTWSHVEVEWKLLIRDSNELVS